MTFFMSISIKQNNSVYTLSMQFALNWVPMGRFN